jgi:hypothetical protein
MMLLERTLDTVEDIGVHLRRATERDLDRRFRKDSLSTKSGEKKRVMVLGTGGSRGWIILGGVVWTKRWIDGVHRFCFRCAWMVGSFDKVMGRPPTHYPCSAPNSY